MLAVGVLAGGLIAAPAAPASAGPKVEHARPAAATWRTFTVNVPAASSPGAQELFRARRSCNANEVVVNSGYALNATFGGQVLQLVAHSPVNARTWVVSVLRLPTPGLVQLSLLCVRNAPFTVHFERSAARINAAREAAGVVFPRQTRLRRQCAAGRLPVGYGLTQLPANAAVLTRRTARRVGKRWEYVFVNRIQRAQRIKLVLICLRPGREPLRVSAFDATHPIAAARRSPETGEAIPGARTQHRQCPAGRTLVGYGYRVPGGVSIDAVIPALPNGRGAQFSARNSSTFASQRFLTQVVCVLSEALARGTASQPPRGPIGPPR